MISIAVRGAVKAAVVVRVAVLVASFASVLVIAAAAGQQAVDAVTVETLLEQAGQYVLTFEGRFSDVVTEERYRQEAVERDNTAGMVSGRGSFGRPLAPPASLRRELVSDFLLVKLRGSNEWMPFRDVFEVDGQRIRDRQDRLTTLFLQPAQTAFEQAQRIMDESARYNIGNVARTINLPVFTLEFLRPETQPRFTFTKGKIDASVGANVYIVDYREQTTPTIVRGQGGRDLPSRGRFWIEALTGRVLKSEVILDDGTVRASVTTRYQMDPAYGVAVPVDMKEDYAIRDGSRITGSATYGRFRKFSVEVTDAVAKPPRTITDAVTGMTLVEIPAGRFTMGSPASETGRRNDERQREVAIGRAFFLGRFEVTQSEWRAVLGTMPSQFTECGPTCPIESVSLGDVRQFLDALNARTRDARYRLPTEAEWEYACRAGSSTAFSTGELILTTQANYNGLVPVAAAVPGVSRDQPVAAGSFDANVWGLGDMHGNVAEWTAEGMVRGGSWSSTADGLRCAGRETHPASERTGTVGFRIAADLAARP